jgi:hypothetical protein
MDQNEKAYLGWILDQNKNKDFVQRIMNPQSSPSLNTGDGEMSTHNIKVEPYQGKYYAFPTIQRQGNGLVDKGKNAFFDAMNSGEYIEFNTPGDAEWFSKNYKQIWELK